MSWTIEPYLSGPAVSLTDEAVQSLVREDLNCSPGALQFSAVGMRLADVERFAYGDMFTIRLSGDPWFSGRRLLASRSGTPQQQRIDYTLADPWWFLRIPYEQEWADAGNPGFYFKKSRTILSQDIYGNKINTGQQIRAALQFALDNAASLGEPPPFQIGLIEPSADAPWREVNGATCHQVVEMMLAWTPDAAGWLDHSTLPPTLHIRRYANLPIIGLNMPRPVAEIPHLVARHDLVSRCNIIHYEIPVETGAESLVSVVTRQYPPGASGYEWERSVETIDLGGQRVSYLQMSNTTEFIRPDLESWWKSHCPEYDHPHITLTRIRGSDKHPGTWEDNPAYPLYKYRKELTSGSLPDWSGATAAQQTFRAKVRIAVYNSATKTDANLLAEVDKELQATLIVTNATTNLYSMLGSFEAAEPIPTDLERTCYEAQSILHHDGDILLREEWPSMAAGIGNRVNLSGPEIGDVYANINAMVQRRRITVGPGKRSTTALTVGAPHRLSLADNVELQRRTRYRLAPMLYERVSGKQTGRKLDATAAASKLATGAVDMRIIKHTTETEPTE